MGKFCLVFTVMAILATPGVAEMTDTQKRATDFTTPTYGNGPTGECAEQRVMPDWFNEGGDAYRTMWKVHLRESYYAYKRRENIVATGLCDCDTWFPDPEQWREDFDRLVALYTNEDGLKEFPDVDPEDPLTRRFSRERSKLVQQYLAVRRSCKK